MKEDGRKKVETKASANIIWFSYVVCNNLPDLSTVFLEKYVELFCIYALF